MKITEIVGINQDILWELKNRIYQPLKKQLGKIGTQIKRNTVTVNLNSILASRKAQDLKNI